MCLCIFKFYSFETCVCTTVDSLYLDYPYPLSRVFPFLVQKPRSFGHLYKPQAIFLSLSRTTSISNIFLSLTSILVPRRAFSPHLELFPPKAFPLHRL